MPEPIKGPEIKDSGKIVVIASGSMMISSSDPRVVVVKK
jgi:hypothetical protein